MCFGTLQGPKKKEIVRLQGWGFEEQCVPGVIATYGDPFPSYDHIVVRANFRGAIRPSEEQLIGGEHLISNGCPVSDQCLVVNKHPVVFVTVVTSDIVFRKLDESQKGN